MHDPARFDQNVYHDLGIEDKLKSIHSAMYSIINTLEPGSPLVRIINLKYMDLLIEELSVYLSTFKPVVDSFSSYQMDIVDIEYIETRCKDASSIYKNLSSAINWLYSVHEALTTIEDDKRNNRRFDISFRNKCHQHLQNECRDALIIVLDNL